MSRKGQRIIAGAASVAVLICALSLDYVRETLNQQAAALPLAVIEDDVNTGSDRQNTATRRIRNATTSAAVVTTTGQVLTNTTIVESAKYVSVAEFPALLSVVSNLTSIVGNHLDDSESNSSGEEENDRQFIYKQVDAIYDSLSDSADDAQEDISALTASVDDLEDDVASLTASLTGLAFVQGGNAFGATTTLGTTDNQPLSLITNGTERLTITADGKVGIGTTTPSGALDVAATITTGNASFPIASAANISSTLNVDPVSDASLFYYYGSKTTINTPATNSQPILALSGGSFDTTHNGSGNFTVLVGIESLASNNSLTGLGGSLMGGSLTARNAGGGVVTNAYGLQVSVTKTGSGTTTNAYGVYINNIQGTNTWGLYQTNATNRNYFAGNVNIGTTATGTNSKLTVVSNSVASTTLRLESPRVAIVSGNILGGIDFASNDTNLTAVSGTTTASILARANETHTASALGTDLVFSTTNGTTTAERMRILGSGNVGIGTSTPGQALTVAGTIQATNLLGGATNITTDASGNIIRDPSDERLKTNVNTLENALDIVLSLRGVSYEWRDAERFGDQTEIGFIAQEVDLVLPEVVQKGGEYWSLNRSNMVAVVVEAVKEIYARMEAYFAENDREIERLQNQNEVLNARVEALEDALDIEVEPEEEETPVDTGAGDDTDVVGEPVGDETLAEPPAPPTPTEPQEPVEPQQPVEPPAGDEPPPSVPPTL